MTMQNAHFDAVIIGSGFGGSVMAYRLAEAGLRVCLLERGKPYPPNSFPRAPHLLGQNFWDPSKGRYGMFDVWSFKGSGALVSSGLGGGSLIYANIHLRKDPHWFKEDEPDGSYTPWPITYEDLERHYERVEKMMNVQKYPLEHAPYSDTPKTLAMREANEKLKLDDQSTHEWIRLNLAVSFRTKCVNHPDEDDPANPPIIGAQIQEKYRNYHSVVMDREMPRTTCRLCGECDIGCNYGSKNTLDYTYVTAAIHQQVPAQVETLCEVKTIAPLNAKGGKGYSVTFVTHDPSQVDPVTGKCPPPPKTTITCDRLILAAGTFGSPYLLLKNQDAFPHLSKTTLGSRFCVNGDLLSFIAKSKEQRNGKMVPRRLDPSFGPVITSAIRVGDTLDGHGPQGRGFYTEDGGNPYLLSWVAEVATVPALLYRFFKFIKMRVKYGWGLNPDANLSAEISDLLGPANTSKSSFPVLTMGRDFANGRLFLKENFLDCDWTEKKSKSYFDRVHKVGRAISASLNAEYLDNPSYKYLHQVLTAHPLGGCPMGFSRDDGVVNSYGESFDYPGLYVVDGSIMPGPVGPNPSLTIAAISDRAADEIIRQYKGATT
ncbi:MAG TPA: GMC family oxidoreductase [Pyrinomonadaceae bacterium]|nr:GMC family oxidoreductase [Pyrinomonadaceae bacterium]